MKPKEHIEQADLCLQRADALTTRYGVPMESIPACQVLAALALAHATTASAQLMALESVTA